MKDKMISISDKILTVIVVVIMMAEFLSFAIRSGTRFLIKIGKCNETFAKIIFFDNPELAINEKTKNNSINWELSYPFNTEFDEYYDVDDIITVNTIMEKDKTNKLKIPVLEKIIQALDIWVDAQTVFKKNCIDNSVKIKKYIGMYSFDNDTYKLLNGHFTNFVKAKDSSQKSKAIIKFNNCLKTLDTPFLYVQAPFKVDPNDKTISGKKDFSNQNTDEFLATIQDAGIDFIDLRNEIKKAGLNHYDCFYKTDHHWKAETGLWATKIIAKKLNEKFLLGIEDSVFDFENYNFEILKDSFLGSRGREVTLANADMEDFTLITPKKEYSIEAEFYSETNILRKASGGFDVLLFPENIQTKETVYTRGTYGIYMDGDTSARIKNNSAENDLRILFLGDSFTDVVEPFFALGVKEFDTLDLRHFTGSLTSWLEQNEKYDAVIMLVNAGSTAGEIDYTTHTNLWDFR